MYGLFSWIKTEKSKAFSKNYIMSFEERKEFTENNEIKWAKIVIQDNNTGDDNVIYFCDEAHKEEAYMELQKESDYEKYEFIVATKKHQEYYLRTQEAEQMMFNVLYGKSFKPITNAYKHELCNYIRWFDSFKTVHITYFTKNGSKTFLMGKN